MDKYTKNYCLVLLIIQLVCGISIYGLYYLDTEESTLKAMKDYMSASKEYMYGDDRLSEIEEMDAISQILKEYGTYKQSEFIWMEPISKVDSVDEASKLYEELLPDNINKANEYVRPYIYTHACYDVIHANVVDTEDYWEIEATYLREKSLHEILTVRNNIGFVYKYMNYIILGMRVTMLLCCILVIVALNKKYLN